MSVILAKNSRLSRAIVGQIQISDLQKSSLGGALEQLFIFFLLYFIS